MKAQITLTVDAAKQLISGAIMKRRDFQAAYVNGRILLKGGTTVSLIAEKMGLPPLRISGRISRNGAKSAKNGCYDGAHSILFEKDKVRNIDEDFTAAVTELTASDVVVIGANALDSEGYTGILLGSPLGGRPGQGFSGLMAQGCKVIIACGLEKLIPGSIREASMAAGLSATSWSMGMSCGLVPLFGEVVTEQSALEQLFSVKAVVIASGGICGGEGSTTLIVEGEESAVKAAVELVVKHQALVNYDTEQRFAECSKGSTGCTVHKNCAWLKAKGDQLAWYEK